MNRIEKVRKLLETHHLDSLIIDNPLDLFYLTGFHLSLGRLIVSKKDAVLFVDGRYFEKCKGHPTLSVQLTKGYGADSQFVKEAAILGKKVGFDSSFTTYLNYEELLQLKRNLTALNSPIKRLREIKEASEIQLLRESAELGSKGFDLILTLVKEGVKEEELAVELELFWKKSGGEKLAFAPNIAFGSNSAYPHYHAAKAELKPGHPILIDIGVVKDNYYSDMTRVVFFKKPYGELETIYYLVKEAQAKALAKCKPGVLIKEVDKAARSTISEKGYNDFFPHSLGHGVGLEIHEFPTIRSTGEDAEKPLQEGMVITIEPGIYLPGVGGVRLEDTIVITKDGYENLTKRPLPISLPIV